jgi:chromosome segregation protein
LKQRIIREGEVDPTSVERYEEENKRLEDLSRQKEDLNNAAGILKKTISRLTETSEQRFMQTFEAVRHNFSRLAPRLFGGGKAELTLTDPSKPLDSGVEILARPPGKKPKSIDLLSGGEKALCATALIFAMFLERPSPLCVLDEVDAPLDEANLVRFLTLIKEMSLKTQFLMITHNKESMSMADNLVGVTMQEPGASKVITVSLQEAVSQVA